MNRRNRPVRPWPSCGDILTATYVKPVSIIFGARNITTLFANLAEVSWSSRGKKLNSFWTPLAMAVRKQIGKYCGRCKQYLNVHGVFGMQMKEEPNPLTLI
jgi:hypothetical protein